MSKELNYSSTTSLGSQIGHFAFSYKVLVGTLCMSLIGIWFIYMGIQISNSYAMLLRYGRQSSYAMLLCGFLFVLIDVFDCSMRCRHYIEVCENGIRIKGASEGIFGDYQIRELQVTFDQIVQIKQDQRGVTILTSQGSVRAQIRQPIDAVNLIDQKMKALRSDGVKENT